MNPFMPVVHEARRTIRNRERGNPFTTDARVVSLIEKVTAAYMATRNDRVARQLHVELDRLEALV